AVEECRRIPQERDQVLASVFVLYKGHWGHSIRTGALGRPSQIQEQVFEAVLEVSEKSLQLMQPGKDLNEVPLHAEMIIRERFPEIKSMDIYKLKTGHSLGLDYSDPILSDVFPPPSVSLLDQPNQAEKSKVILKPGMLFEIHPNLFLPSKAVGAIGDMVLITDNGNEVLTKYTRELIRW
ncbi:MAG: M24 family metallopeptidase, partial [Desulfarculaceae bacterium]